METDHMPTSIRGVRTARRATGGVDFGRSRLTASHI